MMLLSSWSVIQIIKKKKCFKFLFILEETDKGTVLPILGITVNCRSKNLKPDFKDIKEIKFKRICYLICFTQASWFIENHHIHVNICILQKFCIIKEDFHDFFFCKLFAILSQLYWTYLEVLPWTKSDCEGNGAKVQREALCLNNLVEAQL